MRPTAAEAAALFGLSNSGVGFYPEPVLELSGIDGTNAVELDELDLILIDPLPPYVWFQDMADFAEGVSDLESGRDLTQALQGRGAFRRFKNRLYDHHPELISSWHALRDVRAQRRAVKWLLDQELIDHRAAEEFVTRHPDPDLP